MIADKIAADIKSENLPPGMPVPSSRELSRTFGVSQVTAVHALNFLAKRGLLRHKPGQNYYVSRKVDDPQNSCRFISMLFRYISTKGPEFYGNRIISGIMNEGAVSSVGTYFTAYAQLTMRNNKNDFSRILDEALSLPNRNIGFIADFYIPDEIIEEIVCETRLPAVVIGRVSKLDHVHSVVMNAIPSYRQLLQTLKRLGYDAFICCESCEIQRHECLQQRQFFREIAEKEQVVIIPDFNVIQPSVEQKLLRNAMQTMKNRRIAVLTPSDYMARLVMDIFKEMDLKVPEQIGVAGFYGTRISTDYSPRLCTLSIQPELLGKTAAQLLLSEDTRYQVHELPMEFVFGETV